jgi:hypothetical protein
MPSIWRKQAARHQKIIYAFHLEEAGGQAPEDYFHKDERQCAPTFKWKIIWSPST